MRAKGIPFFLCLWATACIPTVALSDAITYDVTIQMTTGPYTGQIGHGQVTYDPALGPELGLQAVEISIFGAELTLANTDRDPGAQYPVPNFDLGGEDGLEAGWGPVVPDSAGYDPGTSTQPAFAFYGPQFVYDPYGWIFLPGSKLCGKCVIGDSGEGASYSGSVTYNPVAAVPEPATSLLVWIALLITPVRKYIERVKPSRPNVGTWKAGVVNHLR